MIVAAAPHRLLHCNAGNVLVSVLAVWEGIVTDWNGVGDCWLDCVIGGVGLSIPAIVYICLCPFL